MERTEARSASRRRSMIMLEGLARIEVPSVGNYSAESDASRSIAEILRVLEDEGHYKAVTIHYVHSDSCMRVVADAKDVALSARLRELLRGIGVEIEFEGSGS